LESFWDHDATHDDEDGVFSRVPRRGNSRSADLVTLAFLEGMFWQETNVPAVNAAPVTLDFFVHVMLLREEEVTARNADLVTLFCVLVIVPQATKSLARNSDPVTRVFSIHAFLGNKAPAGNADQDTFFSSINDQL